MVSGTSSLGSIRAALVAVGLSILGLPTIAAPSEVAPLVEARYREIREIAFRGDHPEASRQALELLDEVERSHGSASLETARALTLLGYVKVWDRDRDPRVAGWIDRAVALLDSSVGREHPETANALAIRGFHRWLIQGETEGAFSELQEALAIRERTLPGDHPDLGESLGWSALALALSGDFERALPRFDRAASILVDETGDRLSIYWLHENHRAMALQNAGHTDEARSAYARLVSGSRDALGEEHRIYAESVVDQAQFFWANDEYAAAVAGHRRGVDLTAKILGDDHVRVLWFRAQYAGLLAALGELALAQQIFDEIMDPFVRAAGPDNPLLADVHRELIAVHRGLGDLEQAREAAQRFVNNADRMHDPVFGAVGRIELADILVELGESAAAIEIVKRGLEMGQRVAPDDLAGQAFGIFVLAKALWRAGKSMEAASLFATALDLWERELGPNAPVVAEALRSVAEVRLEQGQAEAALEALRRAVAIERETLGNDHPRLGASLAELARVNALAGQRDEAWKLALEADAVSRRHLLLTAGSVSTRQALIYADTRSLTRDLILALALDRPEVRATEAWDRLVRSRGAALEEVARRAQLYAAASRRDPNGSRARLAEYQASAAALANLALVPTQNDAPYRKRIDTARRRTEMAERRLAAAAGQTTGETDRVDSAELRGALGDAQVLVSFVRYSDPLSASDEAAEGYVAFVTSPAKAEPQLLRIGSAREIDALVSEWRRLVEPDSPFAEDEPAYRKIAQRLRRKIWDPLIGPIAKSPAIYVVPDGALHAVSFAALPRDHGGYLVEDARTWHYLTHERDLVRPGTDGVSDSGLLAIGGVEFDRVTSSAKVAGLRETPREESLFRDTLPACLDFRRLNFRNLPGSRTEAEEVAAAWSAREGDSRARVLSAAGASEEAFKSLAPGQRVIHIATHGYFLPSNCTSGTSVADNPLLLSGLALAGANDPWSGKTGEENGVLTALEIASLNLAEVDLVVLSACDTATGLIHDVEGVLGLRRAFEIAGARSVVSSLWRIDDADAVLWMRPFYSAFLEQGLPVPAAAAAASRSALNGRRAQGLSTHPVHWAAFVAN